MVLIKKRKPENSHNVVGEDKISNLPEALLHHILSFLPTKCAMSTCILSKRWKYVSHSIPTLDFRYWRTGKGTKKQKLLETKCFMNFIDTVLFLHEKPNIQKFYLDLDEVSDEPRVNRWISTLMKRKVEEFCLYLNCSSTSSIFPLSFFTCDSLALLDLCFDMRSSGKLVIPNTVYFPKLKILRLSCLRFVDETSTRKLFSNCPILEELRLSDCSLSEGLCIVNPTLKHLFINSCCFSKSNVTISAPNLLTISYTRNRPPADIVLNSFSSLVEADVGLHITEGSEYPSEVLLKLFEKLSTAKLLKICGDSFMVLREADILLTSLPMFNNLIHLEISSRFRYTSAGSDSASTVRTFFRFLQMLPNLESILFAKSFHIPEEEEEDDNFWQVDPKPSLPRLKSIKFKKFEGEPMEINVIKLFLLHARFLEIVTIVASPWPQKDHEEVLKLLQMFPKPAHCVVQFLMSSEDT